ncbi:MAG: 3-phosphoglycerate dehydrogenase [Bacteroidales bacterium]
MTKLLIATEKPFHPDAIPGIKEIAVEAGYEVALLEKYTNKADLLDAVKDATALIVRSDKITSEVIDAAQKLKIVVRAGAGYDNVDLKAATKKGIVVMNTPGQNSNAVAELALGMMVYHARGQFNGKPGTELRNKTLGIHAFGNVGQLVAEIAKGFNMKIYAYDPFLSRNDIQKHGVKPLDSAEELYGSCQYVSLHIPANDKTKRSVNYSLLNSMPENATLVNTARKEVIHEEDLLKVMQERKDINYLSDIAPDNAEQIRDKCQGQYFFTPKKMGAQTAEANINAGLAAARQIVNFLEKNDNTYQVN